jgi:hypothetical protein
MDLPHLPPDPPPSLPSSLGILLIILLKIIKRKGVYGKYGGGGGGWGESLALKNKKTFHKIYASYRMTKGIVTLPSPPPIYLKTFAQQPRLARKRRVFMDEVSQRLK